MKGSTTHVFVSVYSLSIEVTGLKCEAAWTASETEAASPNSTLISHICMLERILASVSDVDVCAGQLPRSCTVQQ